MYVVTGAAGFIGSNIVAALNRRGFSDILAVDDFTQSSKIDNLRDRHIIDYIDRVDFLSAVESGKLDTNVHGILHQGACTNTMEHDGRYMMENNYRYSKTLLHYALTQSIPFVYASSAAVYGTATEFSEQPSNEKPLNVYGHSKLLFDNYVRSCMRDAKSTLVGLRYFNVYGPNEAHKGPMASMVYQLYRQLADTGTMRLFEGTGGFADGEQKRDFIFVGDIVDINLHFLDSNRQGIFNAGTGHSRSFNELARALISLHGDGEISYVPFPDSLRQRYQHFTEANLTALRRAGYDGSFTTLESGVGEYHASLSHAD